MMATETETENLVNNPDTVEPPPYTSTGPNGNEPCTDQYYAAPPSCK